MEIDTGSDVSIINEETFKALKAADPKLNFQQRNQYCLPSPEKLQVLSQ